MLTLTLPGSDRPCQGRFRLGKGHSRQRSACFPVEASGSADGTAWGAKSIAAFPQKFYCAESPLLLDLTTHADVKFVRAHWEVARWGRGTETPMFEFGVTLKEVPANILKEAAAEAKAMA